MKQYLDTLKEVRENGSPTDDRTGTGTISTFGKKMEFDLKEGFPLVTTKKVHLKSIIHELLWFISGDTNTKYLKNNGVKIWDEWATYTGDLGPVYGAQWRKWNGRDIDQLRRSIVLLIDNPDSRRNIVTAWNPEVLSYEYLTPQENVDLGMQALPPCHMMFQLYSQYTPSTDRRELSLQMYQRSADMFLGVPFNIASYSLLLMMIAQVTNHDVGKFHHVIGDAHIYTNHLEQVDKQLSREPRGLAKMLINPNISDITNFKYEDFKLDGYNPHGKLTGKVAI